MIWIERRGGSDDSDRCQMYDDAIKDYIWLCSWCHMKLGHQDLLMLWMQAGGSEWSGLSLSH